MSEGTQNGGLLAWANQEWRRFINRLEVVAPDTYDLWMLKANTASPKSIDPDHDKWRTLVQQAFFEGYEAGFSSRILKGDVNERTE